MQCSVSAVPGMCPVVPGMCPFVPGRCPLVPGGCSMVQGSCSIVPGRCPMVLGRCPMVLGRCLHLEKIFLKLLGPGVLAKSNTDKGGQLTYSVPMSTRRQPSNPRLRFRLLGCQLVDIGMKLHLVHFAVKFSSASASETKSNQVGLSPMSSQPRLATLDSVNFRLDLGRLGWN